MSQVKVQTVTVPVTVRVDREALDEVEALAACVGRSKSFLISEAVKFGLPAMLSTYRNLQQRYDENLTAAKSLETV